MQRGAVVERLAAVLETPDERLIANERPWSSVDASMAKGLWCSDAGRPGAAPGGRLTASRDNRDRKAVQGARLQIRRVAARIAFDWSEP